MVILLLKLFSSVEVERRKSPLWRDLGEAEGYCAS